MAVEKILLAGSLGNEKAVTPLLRFLKTIGIGGENGRERRSGNGNGTMTKKVETYLDKLKRG